MKRYLPEIFFDEIYSITPKKNYEFIKRICNQINEIWSTDLAHKIDYKTSNNKGYRFIFINIDNVSEYTWAIALKSKNSQIITENISKFPTTSKRSPLKIESDRGKEC